MFTIFSNRFIDSCFPLLLLAVYFYVLLGVGATASFYVNAAATPPVEGYGSILNVAFAYAFGIVMALIAIAPTSGGHCTSFDILLSIFLADFWSIQCLPATLSPSFCLKAFLFGAISPLRVAALR